MRYAVVVVVAAVMLAAGAQGAAAQPALTLRIVAPANGSTVQNPVRVRVEIGGGTVAEATAGNPQALHYHILVDVDPATVVQPGQPLPTGRSEVIHTANLDFPLTELSPGRHTISVILTRSDHVPLSPNIQDQATFTVAAGQAAGTPAPAGTAGSAPVTGMPRTGAGSLHQPVAAPVMALIVLALPAVVTGAAVIRRRRGR